MTLGPDVLQKGRLNYWEAMAVNAVQSDTLQWKWIPGYEEEAGNQVDLTVHGDGNRTLLLKARDRAGNVSPDSAQAS